MITSGFKLPKIRVQDRNGQYDETLTCIDRSTFEHDVELNQSDQIVFTARADDSVGYQLLTNENYLLFNGQTYVVKISEKDDSGYDLKRNITATHIRFDAQYVYQYQKWIGQKTVSPDELLSFVFDQNTLGNNGFTWEVQGNPGTVAVEDYGEVSGQDCINDCCEKFNMVIQADNKHLKLITMDSFVKKVNASFRYLNNTTESQISIDTTELQNAAMCYGKTKDSSDDANADNQSPVIVPAKGGILTISTMEPKGAPVYTKPGDDSSVTRYLVNGTSWKVDKKQTVNDKTWYRVSGTEWVSEDYAVFDKPGDQQPEDHEVKKVKGQGTVKAAEDSSGNTPTSAKLYDSPWTPQHYVRDLANGGQYKIDKEVDNGAQGKTWYRVAATEWIASDDMDFSGPTDVAPKEVENANDGSDEADKPTEYYFDPFIVQDGDSINRWGLRAGPAISDERFTDEFNMRQYALTAMKSEPDVTITLTNDANDNFNIGDQVYVDIRPENFNTWVTVTAIKENNLSYNNVPEVTLNSSPQSLTDYEISIQKSLQSAKAKLQNIGNTLISTI